MDLALLTIDKDFHEIRGIKEQTMLKYIRQEFKKSDQERENEATGSSFRTKMFRFISQLIDAINFIILVNMFIALRIALWYANICLLYRVI